MCGFIITNIENNLNLTKKILNHRGPDNTGTYRDENITIVFNRLAIIDLNSRSNQPFIKNDFILTYNGEIYNYLEIKKKLKKKGYQFKTSSDTEVLINSYIEWGKDCLQYFEGMFAFCIFNRKKKTIFAARDKYGIKPLFIYRADNKFILTSEKKAIFELGVNKRINKSQVANYIAHGVYQHNKETFYQNIESVEPGSFITIKNNKVDYYKWAEIKISNYSKISIQDAQSEFKRLFNKSIKLCLRSDKKVSLALSGGIDSAAIAFTIDKIKKDALINNVVHWTCNDENDESKYAKDVSGELNKELFISIFKKEDFFSYISKAFKAVEEPFGGLNNMSAMKMYEKLNLKKSRVILDGNGADEILGGYKHHIDSYNNNQLNYSIQPVQGLNIDYQADILKKDFRSMINKFKIKKKFDDPLKDSMYNDLMGTKLRRSLYQNDHITMANSLEMRFPFLNNELVNFCYSLPNKHLVKKGLGKLILRKSFKNSFFMQSKRPIQTPQTLWMKKFVVKNLINKLNNDEKIKDYKIFNIKKLVTKLENWRQNDMNNSVFPWQILMIYTMLKNNF